MSDVYLYHVHCLQFPVISHTLKKLKKNSAATVHSMYPSFFLFLHHQAVISFSRSSGVTGFQILCVARPKLYSLYSPDYHLEQLVGACYV